jgi:hypothetical protein
MPLLNPPRPEAVVWILMTIIAAFALYALRCRARFWFGICEIVTSVFVMYITFVPQKLFFLMNEGASVLGNYLVMGIGITTGIYIFVRGMDNLDNDLPAGWRGPWDRVFRGKWNA